MNCTNPDIHGRDAASREAAIEAVRVLGGPTKAARLLRVPNARRQTVQSWLRSGVPERYCPDIEAETRARGAVVHCERLRPDVAWGRIRGQEGPAAVEEGEAAHGDTFDAAGPAVHPNTSAAVV